MPWADNSSSLEPIDYLAVTCFLPKEDAWLAVEMFLDCGLKGVQWEDGLPLQSPFMDFPIEPGEPFVRGYFPMGREFDAAKGQLEQKALERGWTVSVEAVHSEDWANNWKQYYQPIYLRQGYAVIPQWMDLADVDEEHGVSLDPGMAFGTGSHPTTFMCLNEIIALDPASLTVLDLGAGSGVLAILAARMHAKEVLAVEPDPVAYKALQANIRHNHVNICTVLGTLQDVGVEYVFDLAFLNLIADIIIPLWSLLLTHLHSGSRVILSGILWERRHDVVGVVEQSGCHVVKIIERSGWATMVVAI
jgi:ribosomal protein L11 methyltransferase